MRSVVFAGLLYTALLGAASDKKLPVEHASNELVEVSATLLDSGQIQRELGVDVPEGILVLKTSLRTLSEKPVTIGLDDFALLNTGDGQRSLPYSPTQIAGNSALVVGPRGTRAANGQTNGPSFGGMPIPMPRRKKKEEAAPNKPDTPPTTVASAEGATETALLKALKEHVLPEKQITETQAGLLYFQMEGKKIKPKDLELYYKTPAGRLALRFQP